jgi:hypothetical protein
MGHDDGRATSAAQAEAWEVAQPLLNAMYNEFKELSKKKPDGAVSKAKIEVVNRLLEKCREVLAGEASLDFLDLLDEDVVPQNSDVVLMLSQYHVAMDQFHASYHGWSGVEHTWALVDDE